MGLFKKKAKAYSYDKECMKPVIKTSICTGEQVAGFKDIHTGKIEDIMPVSYTHLILINGAGGNNKRATTDNEYQHEAKAGQTTFFDLDTEGVDFVFRLNFQGTLIPTQIFAQDMVEKQSGNILNISSMNAYIPLTKIPAYSGAKAAVSNFTQWLATHFAGSKIRCNAIAPGFLVSNQNLSLIHI